MPKEWLDKLEKIEWAQFYADPYSDIGLAMLSVKQKEPERFHQEQQERKAALAPHIERLRSKNPYLRAEHLLAIGIPPGEKLGDLLEEGMRIAVNQEITDPQKIIAILQEKKHLS